METNDDTESPSSLVRKRAVQKARSASFNADREHHHDMYVGVEFKFEKCLALSLC